MRLILLPVLILCAIMVSSCEISNKEQTKIIEVYNEPMHKLVFQKGDVKILDVQLKPHDTTLYHLHRNPFFYVSLDWQKDAAQLLNGRWSTYSPSWAKGEVDCDTSFVTKPIVHRATNGGDLKSRLIGILNMGNGRTLVSNLKGFEISNRWFRSSRLLLNKGDTIECKTVDFPVVLVVVKGTKYKLIQNNQIVSSDKDWVYLEQPYMLTNTGDTLEMIKIEVLK